MQSLLWWPGLLGWAGLGWLASWLGGWLAAGWLAGCWLAGCWLAGWLARLAGTPPAHRRDTARRMGSIGVGR